MIWLLLLAFSIWDVANRGFPSSGWTALAVMGAVTVLVYAGGWRPAVVAGNDAVVVRNPFRTTTIPWSAVTDIDLKDALRIHTKGRVIRAWSVDRGGALTSVMRGMSSRRVPAVRGIEAAALAEMARRGPAEVAVATLRDLWLQRRAKARGTVLVQWAWPVIGAFLALGVLSAVLIAT